VVAVNAPAARLAQARSRGWVYAQTDGCALPSVALDRPAYRYVTRRPDRLAAVEFMAGHGRVDWLVSSPYDRFEVMADLRRCEAQEQARQVEAKAAARRARIEAKAAARAFARAAWLGELVCQDVIPVDLAELVTA
jgi:hypothetical protein